jgi:hypothetical protein
VWTTDQGVEQSVVDTPCLLNDGLHNISDTLARVRAGEFHFNDAVGGRSSFFLPLALKVSDCLHIVYNSFQEIVEGLPDWRTLELHYRALARLLCDRDLKSRVQTKCVDSLVDQQVLAGCSISTAFNWKWEYLERFTNALLPALDVLHAHFDRQRVCSGGGVSEVQSSILRDVEKAVQCTHLRGCTLLLASMCWTIGPRFQHITTIAI